MMMNFQLFIQRKTYPHSYLLLFNVLSLSAIRSTLSLKSLVALNLLIFCAISNATNYDIERKISDSLNTKELSKEIVWLKIENKIDVFSLYKASTIPEIKGSVIILHDLNANPDWPNIIRPLRNNFPRMGWQSLSIQMPIYPEHPNNPLFEDNYKHMEERMFAGIKFLQNKGNAGPIILIAHGMAANMALKYLVENQQNEAIQSVVIISAYDHAYLQGSDLIKKIRINMLDVYAQNDWVEVLVSGPRRLASANLAGPLGPTPNDVVKSAKVRTLALNKTGNLRYRQEIITGANHEFDGQNGELVKVIRGWVSRYNKNQ